MTVRIRRKDLRNVDISFCPLSVFHYKACMETEGRMFLFVAYDKIVPPLY